MGQKKKVSNAVIKRLPRYYRFLTELKNNNVLRISSKELSKKMSLTASQIRQDLSNFGGFGQQGYGYNIELLHNELGKILGVDKGYNMIIIGAGNMGRAIANYPGFRKRGYKLIGIFDADEDKVGKKINDVEISHIDTLGKFVEENKVDIAALSVPREETPRLAAVASNLGIKGLWNFSAMDLNLPTDVAVENVHLSDSLMVLGYRIKNK